MPVTHSAPTSMLLQGSVV
uniref:Uncharacterized protein n=1 Tax=Anguilla anguilla TaxID=7936 RepID=A0A0E9Q4B3_ANGAN